MSFKGLSLNRELIEPALSNFEVGISITPQEKEKFIEYTLSVPGKDAALLHIYRNKDGSTTLNYKVGKNQALSLAIAEYLKEKCTLASGAARPSLSINAVTNEKFQLILEFLKDECNASVSEAISIQHGQQYKVTGKQGDVLSFNLFSTQKLQIQGKPLLLYSETIEILSELFDYKEIIESQLKVIQVDITVSEVVSELEILMPAAYGFIGNKLVSIISPALALRKLTIELSDYSCFAFPALRGLEGYIKLLFSTQIGITIDNKGFGEHFQIKSPNDFELKPNIKACCDLNVCRAIEKSYKYYKSQRHGLFHTDGIPETTRILSSRHDADSIIKKITEIIEETYTSITT